MFSKLHYYTIFVLIICICMSNLCFASAVSDVTSISDTFCQIAQKGDFKLFADKKSGEFIVVDEKTNTKWYSNPPGRQEDTIAKGMQLMDLNSQLLLKYVDNSARSESLINTFTGSVNKDETTFSNIEDGFQIDYNFSSKESKIPLQITLGDGYIEAAVPVKDIVEDGSEVVYAISVLPFFGAGSDQMDGYMLVPDGSGALINYNNRKQTLGEYKQVLYGNDNGYNKVSQGAIGQNANLPIFGTQNGTSGFLAVIMEGDAHGTINARVSGAKSSYNTVFCEFSLRTSDVYEIGQDNQIKFYDSNNSRLEKITIRYYLLTGEDCDYNGMAQTYRNYLTEVLRVQEKLPAEDMPFYIELYGSILKKGNILGIPYVSTQALTPYRASMKLLEEAKSKNINNIVLKYTNANNSDVSGRYTSKFKLLSKLGGYKAFSELADFCNENHIMLLPNADLLTFKKGSNGVWVFLDAIRTLSGAVAVQNIFQLSTDRINKDKSPSYLINPFKLYMKINNIITSIKALKFTAVSLDTMGNMLYSDFYKGKTYRQEALTSFQKSVENIASNVDNIMMSNVNAYMFPYIKYIEDSPQQSSGLDLVDTDIPFYQLAVSGLISYSTPAVNLNSNPKDALLHAAENGSSLKYTWITSDPSILVNTDYMHLYGVDYKAWLNDAAAYYQRLNDIYQKADGTRIVEHRIVDDGVREIKYDNGTRVIINYNTNNVMINGETEVGANDFIVIGGK